jgi:hypothetical protein
LASSSQDDEKKPESSHPEKGRGMKHEILYDSQFDDGFKVPPEHRSSSASPGKVDA